VTHSSFRVNALPSFVIVDDVDENRFLLAKTLLRKFPQSLIVECQDSSTAAAAVARELPAAIIVHRSIDLDGPSVIRLLHRQAPTVPIIMVSGRETCPEAIESGACAFLNYDAWLRIGSVVEEVLSPHFVKALTKTPFRGERDYLGMR
jgi:DNA-binding NtrC family response regulator